jgi:phenylpyruvate tautomerase PptA (4-oxalocrotonate tautomerase family)
MPLINLYLNEGKSQETITTLCDGIHEALMETWSIPEKDRFHMVHEMKRGHMMVDKEMWDVNRSDDVLVLHITSPRTTDMKLAFYKRLPEILQTKAKIRPEDVFISIITNAREDWSFGNGQAQLLA